MRISAVRGGTKHGSAACYRYRMSGGRSGGLSPQLPSWLYPAAARPCSTAVTTAAVDSMPTDSRIVPPAIPSAARAAGDNPRWLVDSGWLSVVDSAPNDGQNGISTAARMKQRRIEPTGQSKADHRPETVAKLSPGHVVVRVIGQARIIDRLHRGRLRQMPRDRQGIGGCPFHPHAQCAKPAQRQPSVKRRAGQTPGRQPPGTRSQRRPTRRADPASRRCDRSCSWSGSPSPNRRPVPVAGTPQVRQTCCRPTAPPDDDV